jgi:hypothetical protein
MPMGRPTVCRTIPGKASTMTEFDPLEFSQLVSILEDIVPHPISKENLPGGTIRMIGGEPGEVVIDLTDKTVTVSEFHLEQVSDRARVLQPNLLGTLHWTQVPTWSTRRILEELTATAANRNRAAWRDCIRCGTSTHPQNLTSSGVCTNCELTDEGVVL